MEKNKNKEVKPAVQHSEREHLKYGGSSAYRWSKCHASVALAKDLPEEPAGPAAEEGTKAHEVAELALRSFVAHKRTGSPYVGPASDDSFLNSIVEQYVKTIWEEVLEGSVTDKGILFEEKMIFIDGLAGGPADFCVVYMDDKGKRAAWIVDFKYGYVEVDIEGNEQLAVYACGLRRMLAKKNKPLEYVNTAIYQPRSNGETFKTGKFTSKELDKWDAKFQKEIEAIEAGSVKAKTGDHCEYCRAKMICIPYKKDLAKKSNFSPLASEEPANIKLPSIDTLSIEQLTKLYLVKGEIENYLTKIETYLVLLAIEQGMQIPGLKLVENKPRRKWKDDTSAEFIKEIKKLSNNKEVSVECLKALTKVETMIPKDMRHELDKYITMTEKKLILVPDTDPRQAVSKIDKSFSSLDDDLPTGIEYLEKDGIIKKDKGIKNGNKQKQKQ